MVLLQRLLIGLDDINPNEVGVVLIPFSVCQTLQQDLYETETPAGEIPYKDFFFFLMSMSAEVQQHKVQHVV